MTVEDPEYFKAPDYFCVCAICWINDDETCAHETHFLRVSPSKKFICADCWSEIGAEEWPGHNWDDLPHIPDLTRDDGDPILDVKTDTVWTRPTTWAWMQLCKARERLRQKFNELQEKYDLLAKREFKDDTEDNRNSG